MSATPSRNEAVILIAIGLILFGMWVGVLTYQRDIAVNKCVVKEYENNTSKDRTQLFDYCRAKVKADD